MYSRNSTGSGCYPTVLPLTSTTFVWIDTFSSASIGTLSGNILTIGNPVAYPNKLCRPGANFAINSSHVMLSSIFRRGILDTNEFLIVKVQGQTVTIGERMAGIAFETVQAKLFQNQVRNSK